MGVIKRVLLSALVVVIGFLAYQVQTRNGAIPPPLTVEECERAGVSYLRLKDGRLMTWEEFGDKDGTPVVSIGGLPSTSRSFSTFDSVFRELNVRSIALTWAPMGLSDWKQDYQITDFAEDAIQVLDHLRIDRFYVFGISTGAPFALSLAARYPQRVRTAGVFGPVLTREEMQLTGAFSEWPIMMRFIVHLVEWAPPVANALLGFVEAQQVANATDTLHRFFHDGTFTASELEKLTPESQTFQSLKASYEDAYARNPLPYSLMAHTYMLTLRPWGFNISDITCDVLVTTATDDVIHNPAFARFCQQINPTHVRVHLEPKGGRLFPMWGFADNLRMLLGLQPVTAEESVANADTAADATTMETTTTEAAASESPLSSSSEAS